MSLIFQALLHKAWFLLLWHEKASLGTVGVYRLTLWIQSSLYAPGSQKGSVPRRVCALHAEKYWSRRTYRDRSPHSFSQRTLLCGSWEDKTLFFSSHNGFSSSKLGHQDPLISNMWKTFPSVLEVDGWDVALYSTFGNRCRSWKAPIFYSLDHNITCFVSWWCHRGLVEPGSRSHRAHTHSQCTLTPHLGAI